MKIKWRSLIAASVFGILAGLIPASAHAESKPYSLLLLGDSNIEFGPIANGYAALLKGEFGVGGSGYMPINGTFVNLAATGIEISSDSGWLGGDMNVNGRHAPAPIYAPSGLWAESSTPGSKLTLTFKGTGLDLYYAAIPGGGTFRVTLDGQDKGEFSAKAEPAATKKASFSGLSADAKHTLEVTVVSGRVILSGADRIEGNGPRAVVHNWGNGSSDTTDFLNVDENVFATGIKELKPDAVVVLLGTNDPLSLDEKQFADQLTEVVKRIQKATNAPVMIISHIRIMHEMDITKDYLSYSYPTVSSRTGCAYWNMYEWFGDGVANLTESSDGVHCNVKGGKRVADELYIQVGNMINPPPATTTTKAATTTTGKPSATDPKKTDATTVRTTAAPTTQKPGATATKAEGTTAAPAETTPGETDPSTELSTDPTAEPTESIGTTETSAAVTDPSDEPADTEPDSPQGGFPVWAIVLIIVAAVAVLGVVGFFLVVKNKKA